jgi:peptide deformylase
MAIRTILHYPDKRLRTPGNPVTEFGPELAKLVEDMAETMYAAPGVGLAANQVGLPLRIFTADCHGEGEPRQLITMINPEIVDVKGEVREEEGCLSVPEYAAPVVRYVECTVKGLGLDGEEQVVTGRDLLARCFQQCHPDALNILGLELSSVRPGQIEDVNGALTIGRDMRGVDLLPALVNRPGEPRQQGGTVAGIDLYQRRPVRCALGDDN